MTDRHNLQKKWVTEGTVDSLSFLEELSLTEHLLCNHQLKQVRGLSDFNVSKVINWITVED